MNNEYTVNFYFSFVYQVMVLCSPPVQSAVKISISCTSVKHIYIRNIRTYSKMDGLVIELAHAFLVIIPCLLIILYRVWTRVVAKKILLEQLNEEFNKMA